MELNTKTKSLAKVQTHLVAECFNKLYIGGEFVDPIDGDKYPTYYPATGELLHEFPRGKANDVESAIAAANAAWAEGTWAGMTAAPAAEPAFAPARAPALDGNPGRLCCGKAPC